MRSTRRLGHEFWKSAETPNQNAMAVGMVLEAIEQNLPPPEREVNPWLELLYPSFTSGEAERRS